MAVQAGKHRSTALHPAFKEACSDFWDVQGAFDPKCLELAKLHSYAVDFPRTGMVVEIPSHLRANKFPDFMWTKRRKHVYYSNTIIGRLFREIEVILRTSRNAFKTV